MDFVRHHVCAMSSSMRHWWHSASATTPRSMLSTLMVKALLDYRWRSTSITSSSLRMMFTRSQSLSKRWPLGSRWVIWKSVLFLAAKKNYARTWFSNNMNSTVSVSELDLHWDRTFRCTIGILLLTSSAVQYNISYIASTSPPSITSKFKIQQTKRKYTDVSQFREMVWVPENKTKCC